MGKQIKRHITPAVMSAHKQRTTDANSSPVITSGWITRSAGEQCDDGSLVNSDGVIQNVVSAYTRHITHTLLTSITSMKHGRIL